MEIASFAVMGAVLGVAVNLIKVRLSGGRKVAVAIALGGLVMVGLGVYAPGSGPLLSGLVAFLAVFGLGPTLRRTGRMPARAD